MQNHKFYLCDMIVIIFRLLRKTRINGITLFPFILLRKKESRKDVVLMNHERIHLRQQAELLIIFFYLWYIVDFIIMYFKYKNVAKAYRSIIFEREAYAEENHLGYLKKRKFWNFLKY